MFLMKRYNKQCDISFLKIGEKEKKDKSPMNLQMTQPSYKY